MVWGCWCWGMCWSLTCLHPLVSVLASGCASSKLPLMERQLHRCPFFLGRLSSTQPPCRGGPPRLRLVVDCMVRLEWLVITGHREPSGPCFLTCLLFYRFTAWTAAALRVPKRKARSCDFCGVSGTSAQHTWVLILLFFSFLSSRLSHLFSPPPNDFLWKTAHLWIEKGLSSCSFVCTLFLIKAPLSSSSLCKSVYDRARKSPSAALALLPQDPKTTHSTTNTHTPHQTHSPHTPHQKHTLSWPQVWSLFLHQQAGRFVLSGTLRGRWNSLWTDTTGHWLQGIRQVGSKGRALSRTGSQAMWAGRREQHGGGTGWKCG